MPPEKYTLEFLEALAAKLLVWMKIEGHFWLGDFAAENGLWLNRLSEFSKKSSTWKRAYTLAKQIQENKLVKLGFESGKFKMAYASLKHVANWRDKYDFSGSQNVTVTVAGPEDIKRDRL